MNKKIVIISYYWPPAGGPGVQRWLKFSKYLPKFNVEPIMFVPKNANYPIIDKSLLNYPNKDLKVIKRPIFEISKFFFLTKLFNKYRSGYIPKISGQTFFQKFLFFIRGNTFFPDMKIFWKKSSVKFLKKYLVENQIDTIITTGPPHSLHLIGYELKKKINIQWIADLRDPIARLNYLKRLNPTKRIISNHIRFRDNIIINADKVIVTSHSLRELYKKINSNIYTITNGFDKTSYISKLDNKFSISYVGSMYPERNSKVLWDQIEIIFEKFPNFKNDFKLNFIGNIDEKIKSNLKSRNFSGNIRFYGYISEEEAFKKMCSSHLLLMVEVDDNDSSLVIPAKIFNYLKSNRPILSIGPKNSDVEKIINEAKAGKYYLHDDKINISKTIEGYYKDFKRKTYNELNIKNINKYNVETLTKDLSKLILKK